MFAVASGTFVSRLYLLTADHVIIFTNGRHGLSRAIELSALGCGDARVRVVCFTFLGYAYAY